MWQDIFIGIFPDNVYFINLTGMLVEDIRNYGKESMKLANGLKLKQLKQWLPDQNSLP